MFSIGPRYHVMPPFGKTTNGSGNPCAATTLRINDINACRSVVSSPPLPWRKMINGAGCECAGGKILTPTLWPMAALGNARCCNRAGGFFHLFTQTTDSDFVGVAGRVHGNRTSNTLGTMKTASASATKTPAIIRCLLGIGDRLI